MCSCARYITFAIMFLAGACSRDTQLAARWRTDQIRFVHHGFTSGPVLISREDGSIVEERRYEPFGAALDAYREDTGGGGGVPGEIDLATFDLGALNQRVDANTLCSYHGARWMCARSGRWLSPDPPVKGPDPKFLAAPWKLHPFQYVLQNPVSFWDPDGRDEKLTGVTPAAMWAGWSGGVTSDGASYPIGNYDLHALYRAKGGALLGYAAIHRETGQPYWVIKPDAVVSFSRNSEMWDEMGDLGPLGAAQWGMVNELGSPYGLRHVLTLQRELVLDWRQQALGLFGAAIGYAAVLPRTGPIPRPSTSPDPRVVPEGHAMITRPDGTTRTARLPGRTREPLDPELIFATPSAFEAVRAPDVGSYIRRFNYRNARGLINSARQQLFTRHAKRLTPKQRFEHGEEIYFGRRGESGPITIPRDDGVGGPVNVAEPTPPSHTTQDTQ
jgi:RHS repeat-associated protein